MQVKYGYLNEQFADIEAYLEDIRGLVKSTEFTLGPYVERFERKFADYVGVRHCISVNNGTDALILALKAVGVKPGDEVISVTNTFYATIGAIVAVGARPVLVDSDDRYQIDVRAIEKAITPRTRAILPVHWAGCPCDIEEIATLARSRELAVVEDACPTVGGRVNGRHVGSFGKVSAFSMHPLKPLNVWGDGGMIVTDDDAAAEWLRLYRNHGMTDRDHIAIWGINARLQPLQAIVASRQLDIMEKIAETRIRNARLLDAGLSALQDFVEVPRRPQGYKEVYQLYIASFRNRDALLKHLVDSEIEAKVHYPVPLHLQAPGRALGYREGDFPKAERQAKEIITIPSHQHVSPEQIAYIIERVRSFY